MERLRTSTAEPRTFALGETLLAVEVDLSLYGMQAVFRACYKLTGRCYVILSRTEEPDWLMVTLLAKTSEPIAGSLVGELYNELLDQQIRQTLETEMGAVRELIVAQAFAEGNLLDPLRDEGNYEEDPLGIGERR
jgi:His-Xaa-Ser system protein HxsD